MRLILLLIFPVLIYSQTNLTNIYFDLNGNKTTKDKAYSTRKYESKITFSEYINGKLIAKGNNILVNEVHKPLDSINSGKLTYYNKENIGTEIYFNPSVFFKKDRINKIQNQENLSYIIQYDKKGNKINEGYYINRKLKHLKHKTFDKKGNILELENYYFGSKTGLNQTYKNSKVYISCYYKKGKKHGSCVYYQDNGVPLKTLNYENDLKNGYEINHTNGSKVLYKSGVKVK